MGLFPKRNSNDPVATLERELSDLVARRGALEQKAAQAKTALAAALDQRRQTLLDSDLSDEAAASRRDAEVRSAQDRHGSLADALQALAVKIGDVEHRLSEARDQAERRELAAAVRTEADTLAKAREQFIAVGAELIPAMQAMCVRLPGVAVDFLPRTSLLIVSELPTAIEQLIADARAFAAQTEAGATPLHRPALPPAPEPVAEPVERMRIYTLQHLKWAEGSQIISAMKYSWASPPLHLATRARERNLADLPDAPRTQKLIAAFGTTHGHVHADDCISLDALDPSAVAERTLPEGFVEKIGEARQMEISVQRR